MNKSKLCYWNLGSAFFRSFIIYMYKHFAVQLPVVSVCDNLTISNIFPALL